MCDSQVKPLDEYKNCRTKEIFDRKYHPTYYVDYLEEWIIWKIDEWCQKIFHFTQSSGKNIIKM